MKFLDLFGLKKTQFYKGWAIFDQITGNVLSVSIIKGCFINMEHHDHVENILLMLRENPELSVFGKISKNGEILLDGLSGLPMSTKCVDQCKNLEQFTKFSKVSHGSVFLEF